ncbi:hypothetical protein AAFF_G00053410 [Aldrovandia affinis]|uniref:Peptidase A2 domain-containing protein n=1 Tax=Aldrovandia affinis TaxID=143900 RepID=A0AAD7T6K9_9TELE|nr:hypothetical protein AAFF_G00053410 [Aldrovandia affinis]
MTARDVSCREIKEEMEDRGLPGLEEWQAGAGVGVDNPGGSGSDSRAAAAAVPGPEASVLSEYADDGADDRAGSCRDIAAPRRCDSFPRAHALLGVWPGQPSPQGLPRSPGEAGKRQGVRLGGAERTPGAMSHADLSPAEGAKRHSWGSGALLPPGAGDGAESVMVVGWTHAGHFCYVPVALAGALVDTGSTATLMRPDVVPVGTQLEQTSVQLRTVTGELAPMLGRGKVVITVGGLSVELRVWVAEVQDPCILGLDFLKFARCLLDLGENTLSFPGGPTVKMISPPLSSRSAPLAVRTTETQIHSASPLASHGSSRPLNARPRCSPAYSTAERSSPIPPAPDSQLTSPAGSTPWPHQQPR